MGKRDRNNYKRSANQDTNSKRSSGSGAAVVSGLILVLLAIGCGYFAIKGDMAFGQRIGLGFAALVLAAIGNVSLNIF